MSCPPPVPLTQVLAVLARGREGVAHGVPSLELALARSPWGRPAELLAQARALASAGGNPTAPPWVRVLAEALAWVAHARALWGTQRDAMPPHTLGEAPCSAELRQHLPSARWCADIPLAWEDSGGLTRPQALCVVQLALVLARWEAQTRTSASAAPPPAPVAPKARRPTRLPYADEYSHNPDEESAT